MHRGFTIIEIIVVVSVIAILASIGIVGYSQYQQRSTDAQARSIAAAIRSAAERYYSRNNEYPAARDVHGATLPTNCSAPTSYTTASNVLSVPAATLKQSRTAAAFWPASGTCTTLNKSNIYYITKSAGDATGGAHSIDGCTYTFSTSETGPTAFTIAYFSIADNKWSVARSNQGTVSASSGCEFTAL